MRKLFFKDGIPGFEHLHDWIFEENKAMSYLYAQKEKDVKFTVSSPFDLFRTYRPVIEEKYFEHLGGEADHDFRLYVIVDVDNATANLAAPILVNNKNNTAMQIIVENDYSCHAMVK